MTTPPDLHGQVLPKPLAVFSRDVDDGVAPTPASTARAPPPPLSAVVVFDGHLLAGSCCPSALPDADKRAILAAYRRLQRAGFMLADSRLTARHLVFDVCAKTWLLMPWRRVSVTTGGGSTGGRSMNYNTGDEPALVRIAGDHPADDPASASQAAQLQLLLYPPPPPPLRRCRPVQLPPPLVVSPATTIHGSK